MNVPAAAKFDEVSWETLLNRISRGEESALSMLYDLASPRVHGITLRILKNEETAEEATLDAFTKIWRQAHQYNRSSGTARVWIHAIARNCALDILRRTARYAKADDAVNQHGYPEPAAVSPETQLFQNEKSQLVKTAMTQLSAPQREVISAAYFGGLSHSEVAKKLNQPLGTVKTRIRKALEVLRLEIQRMGGIQP